MLSYPEIDPILLHLGPIKVRWYGMMYLAGFGACYLLAKRLIKEGSLKMSLDQLAGLTTAMILGVILGGRLGYVLFYDFSAYLSDPARILAIWKGGMSFHGGLLGTLIAGAIFCRREGLRYLMVADQIAVVVPVGLGLVRIANFIGNELVGRVTDVPWAMVFPGWGPLARHPSQLYQATMEGLVLFTIMWTMRKRLTRPGQLLGLFLVMYAAFRAFTELFRQPDAHIGFQFMQVTRGQTLSAVMLIGGIVLLATAKRRDPSPSA